MKNHERELLFKVKEAVFANPFGRTRLAIDLSVTGLSASVTDEKILQQLVEKIGETVNAIQGRLAASSKQLDSEEQHLLRFGILFHVFHIFCDTYDQHITDQVNTGNECCKVDFAADALKMLTTQGFNTHDALRFFSLFFQMRRAYYFINAIAGKSQCVMDLRRSLWHNIFTCDIGLYDDFLWNRMEDFSTMILGETGTGKGLAAGAIGRSGYIDFNPKTGKFSESFAKTFISINLSQFPELLIESELFGHTKGSFTGAVENHQGILSRCSPYGSIFLDEIGDVSIPTQIKLLQVLQERIFTPVGSHKPVRFQGRVIAATNKSLDKSRQNGQFRDDFYYRLCSDVIEVPSLRQRIQEQPSELKEILHIVIKRILGKASNDLVEKIVTYIQQNQPKQYSWPGNIRELEQCARRILLKNSYTWQTLSSASTSEQLIADIENSAISAHELLSRYCKILYKKLGTYEAVAQQTRLDRRTVKKHILKEQ